MNECMDEAVDGGMDLCSSEREGITTLSIVEWSGCGKKELCAKSINLLLGLAGQNPHQTATSV
jgi:hypothetical protein